MLTSNLSNIFSNENYRVARAEDGSKYLVVNDQTGVVEFDEKSLPVAIQYAEHSNAFLVNELWRWIRGQADQQKAELDRSDSVVGFDPDPELMN